MKLCFLIYRYFPYGGQQRDFFKIVSECLTRGHEVEVYALRWQGEQPQGFNVTLAPFNSMGRLGLYRRYSDWVAEKIVTSDPDLVIGFNKMPHLDVYFAADSCFLHKAATQRGHYYKYTPRFKHFSMYEEALSDCIKFHQASVWTEGEIVETLMCEQRCALNCVLLKTKRCSYR
jgi:UDP-glucose:(heptosyl)LPS alpha-1,3-glucosyltransferase